MGITPETLHGDMQNLKGATESLVGAMGGLENAVADLEKSVRSLEMGIQKLQDLLTEIKNDMPRQVISLFISGVVLFFTIVGTYMWVVASVLEG